VFVLISDAGGTNMYIEIGMAITYKNLKNKNLKIYAVGENCYRSLMLNHPEIIHKQSLEEVLKEEGIKSLHLFKIAFNIVQIFY